jgi:hypothetical protein
MVPSYLLRDYNGGLLGDCSKLLRFRNIGVPPPHPMLMGILLTSVAVFIRRWLARGPGGIRQGFTAARLLGKDKHWINVGSTVFGSLSPHSTMPAPQTNNPDFRFGGGHSGGGGASGEF